MQPMDTPYLSYSKTSSVTPAYVPNTMVADSRPWVTSGGFVPTRAAPSGETRDKDTQGTDIQDTQDTDIQDTDSHDTDFQDTDSLDTESLDSLESKPRRSMCYTRVFSEEEEEEEEEI